MAVNRAVSSHAHPELAESRNFGIARLVDLEKMSENSQMKEFVQSRYVRVAGGRMIDEITYKGETMNGCAACCNGRSIHDSGAGTQAAKNSPIL